MKPEDKNLIHGHNYDGIQELDNPLPRWWLVIFYLTIAFAIGYYYHYELGSGPTSDQELALQMDLIHSKKAQAVANAPQVSGDELNALLEDSAALEAGSAEFLSKCAACHGDKGQGLIGPNLTDTSWVHGEGSVADIAQVIKLGVAEKGMPPWEGMIKPDLINKVAAFILSLKGTNPPNAKEAEGQNYE